MKIIFAGTPMFAVPSLQSIYEAYGSDLIAVITQPDKPQGRKGILTPSPVKEEAERLLSCARTVEEYRAAVQRCTLPAAVKLRLLDTP